VEGILFPPRPDECRHRLDPDQYEGRREALLRIQSSFVRTAKFGIGEKRVAVEKKKYRSRSGLLPYFELAFGTYFLGMVAYAIDTFNFLAVPVLMLFVSGYYWAGFSTLWQEYQDRMRFEAAQRMESESAS
jgi:hypothetical protein